MKDGLRKSLGATIDEFQDESIAVLFQLLQKSDGYWSPYLQTFPSPAFFSTMPTSLSDSKLRQVVRRFSGRGGAQFMRQVAQARARINHQFERASQLLGRNFSISHTQWHGAWHAFVTRRWQLLLPRHNSWQPTISFFPVADMLLHADVKNIQVTHDEENAFLETTEELSKGDVLYDTYRGPNCHWHRYLTWGIKPLEKGHAKQEN
jgi:hypothetical protein